MTFWNKPFIPLGNEIVEITQKNVSERRGNVEAMLPAIKVHVVNHLRTWAATSQLYECVIDISNLFGEYKSELGEYVYSEIGVAFSNGMKNIHPLHPDTSELVFIGNELSSYLQSQNLNTEFNESTYVLNINWRTLPNVE